MSPPPGCPSRGRTNVQGRAHSFLKRGDATKEQEGQGWPFLHPSPRSRGQPQQCSRLGDRNTSPFCLKSPKLQKGGAASVRNSDRVTLTLGLFGQTVSMAKLSEEGMSSLGAGA